MKKKLIVGIDVSKMTLDVAITSNGTDILVKSTVPNDSSGYQTIKRLIKRCQPSGVVHICMEATGVYSEQVRDYFQKTSCIVSEVNPSVVRSFRRSAMVRTKTDPVDAKLIALYCAKMNPRPSQLISVELKQLKRYVLRLDYLIRSLAKSKTYISTANDSDILASEKRIMATLKEEIQKTEENIEVLFSQHSNLNKDRELLLSIPGVGKKTVAIVLSGLIQEQSPHNQRYSKKCQSAHAGLAPAQHLSGTSVKGRPYICKSGNAMLRKSLYFPTLSAIRHNPIIKRFYEKLISKGKRKIVAVVACMRKLLMLMIGVLNTQKSFSHGWVSKPYFAT